MKIKMIAFSAILAISMAIVSSTVPKYDRDALKCIADYKACALGKVTACRTCSKTCGDVGDITTQPEDEICTLLQQYCQYYEERTPRGTASNQRASRSLVSVSSLTSAVAVLVPARRALSSTRHAAEGKDRPRHLSSALVRAHTTEIFVCLMKRVARRISTATSALPHAVALMSVRRMQTIVRQARFRSRFEKLMS